MDGWERWGSLLGHLPSPLSSKPVPVPSCLPSCPFALHHTTYLRSPTCPPKQGAFGLRRNPLLSSMAGITSSRVLSQENGLQHLQTSSSRPLFPETDAHESATGNGTAGKAWVPGSESYWCGSRRVSVHPTGCGRHPLSTHPAIGEQAAVVGGGIGTARGQDLTDRLDLSFSSPLGTHEAGS